LVALVAVNDAILPVPLAAKPILAVLFVQLNVLPTDPVKLTAAVGAPLHTTWLAGWLTNWSGITVTVAVTGLPGQGPTGVMIKLTVTGAVVVLVNEPLILPEPLAAIPVAVPVLSLVQVNVVAPRLLVNTMVLMAVPEQMVCDMGDANTLEDGLTVMVNVIGVPLQVPPALVKLGVTVMVATIGAVDPLVAVKEGIFPVPLAARPIAGALLVQLNTVPAGVPLKLTAVVAVLPQRV
jgi:hypothetical protein